VRRTARQKGLHKRVYGGFQYQVASWDKLRRIIAKVEWHPGEPLNSHSSDALIVYER